MLRIAVIQHGDYVEAKKTIASGVEEPYFGMSYTLEVLDELFQGNEYLVVSLNTAKPYSVTEERGRLMGFERFSFPKPIPASLGLYCNAKKICKEIERYQPTHVLVRTAGIYAWTILRYCTKHDLNTMVVFANTFDNVGIKDRLLNWLLIKQLNQKCVYRVTNHKQPATDSMVEVGLNEEKAMAWDWPGAKHPKNYPVKQLSSQRKKVFYVGAVTSQKGVPDLLGAIKRMLLDGDLVSLTIAGTGLEIDNFKEQLTSRESEFITFLGRVNNQVVFDLMLESDVVCVPSRHVFTEGMPLTLTEALASRTPVVISDHPVFQRAFIDGEGVKFFPEKDSEALAMAIRAIVSDPIDYQKLSATTLAAFERVECTTTFGDIIFDWRDSWQSSLPGFSFENAKTSDNEGTMVVPDWSRERPRRFWDPSRKLLRSIRRYQEYKAKNTILGTVMSKIYVVQHMFWQVITGADIPLNCSIGGGLMLPHPNGVVISPSAKIGANCLIFQQVTLGSRGTGAPDIGDHVNIGAGAKILGDIEIGEFAKVGANAVVIGDVLAGKTVVGVPAKTVDP